MEDFECLVELDKSYVLPTYKRDMMLVKGQGSKIWDAEGNEYLDFGTGISVCNLGHCHPVVSRAIADQAGKLVHCSNLFYNELQPQLAAEIARNSFEGKVFFCNSGAEANEGLIKFARRWGSRNGGKYEIICAKQSFHGRTLATLAATANQNYREGFSPDLSGFAFAEYNNLAAFEAAITPQTAAILVEPVQGEGGVYPADKEFLQGLRKLCDDKNILLLLDEVQTGMGRCGSYFAYQKFDIIPDGISLAKALGNGFPMGAFQIKAQYADLFAPGVHGSTFGGTPLACAASLAVFKVLKEENVIENVQKMSTYLFDKLAKLKNKYSAIKALRGLGLLVGIEVGDKVSELQAACRKRQLIVLTAGNGVLRLLPSLLINEKDVDLACSIIDEAMQEVFVD